MCINKNNLQTKEVKLSHQSIINSHIMDKIKNICLNFLFISFNVLLRIFKALLSQISPKKTKNDGVLYVYRRDINSF